MVKVFLTGGDNVGWALDEDLRLTRQALEQIPEIELVDLDSCDVIHSCWWFALEKIPAEKFAGKKVICHMSGEPFRYFQQPDFSPIVPQVNLWLSRSQQAQAQLNDLGLVNCLVPYLVDLQTFRPLFVDKKEKEESRSTLGIPQSAYVIGSFQRDTEGADLVSPKYVKGPDILLEIVSLLQKKGYPVHLLLAGPRRFWLRKKLEERDVPFTFMGEKTEKDDLYINTLPRSELNRLYNLLDCYVVASRSEGGPHAVLEAVAAKCPVISPPVGLAPDVIDSECIYTKARDAVHILERDITQGILSPTTTSSYQRLQQEFSMAGVVRKIRLSYKSLEKISALSPPLKGEKTNRQKKSRSRVWNILKPKPRELPELVVGLWHTYHRPPYGGGNQFMLALRKELSRQGIKVLENQLSDKISFYLLNSIHFDIEAFTKLKKQRDVRVLHRIDGPIHLIRGFDREKDELCYKLNSEFASATVLQSNYVYRKIVEFGYQPVNPVIIHNAVDADIFNRNGKLPFNRNRKIRLISISWSGNPRKGGAIYHWIEEHLDWKLFEYTFVGNTSEPLLKAQQLSPVGSEELAKIIKQHDIYITASQNDPCSNALIEALACGLPALYLNSGGHPELVGMGGLPFEGVDDIMLQLEAMVNNYEIHQNLIVVPTIRQVAEKYLAVMKKARES
jgi:glycosyltransferase involved in cell wall biosynthesis